MEPFVIEKQSNRELTFINKVYTWMSTALLITAFTAWWAATTPSFMRLFYEVDSVGNILSVNKALFFGLIIGQLGLVIWISSRIQHMTSEKASVLFVIYSILTGITLSSVFIVYTSSSISSTFFITAATFSIMSFYGYTTKRDLTNWGNLLFMGLIGLMITTFVNVFLQSPMIHWIMNYLGVILFVGLTAYDTQKIKAMANEIDSEENAKKGAIIGALTLYLDFINLFLYLLRIFGDRK